MKLKFPLYECNWFPLSTLHTADLMEEKIIQASPLLTPPAPTISHLCGLPNVCNTKSLDIEGLQSSFVHLSKHKNNSVLKLIFFSLSLHVRSNVWTLTCIDLFTSTALHPSQELGLRFKVSVGTLVQRAKPNSMY